MNKILLIQVVLACSVGSYGIAGVYYAVNHLERFVAAILIVGGGVILEMVFTSQ